MSGERQRRRHDVEDLGPGDTMPPMGIEKSFVGLKSMVKTVSITISITLGLTGIYYTLSGSVKSTADSVAAIKDRQDALTQTVVEHTNLMGEYGRDIAVVKQQLSDQNTLIGKQNDYLIELLSIERVKHADSRPAARETGQ